MKRLNRQNLDRSELSSFSAFRLDFAAATQEHEAPARTESAGSRRKRQGLRSHAPLGSVSFSREKLIRGISDMAKVLCVLYDDPVDGYPKSYPRDDLPRIESYPGGQTLPTPKAIDFKPGTLLGSVSGELGLRKYLESREILECWFEKRPIRNEYLIVDGGKLAGAGAHSYSAGDATKGSEEAAKFGSAR
jgi:hypothetical protein